MKSRVLVFLYGAICYTVCLGSFFYAAGFIGNFAVPKSMDSISADPWPRGLLIDLGLLALFAVQHSVMARPGFKRIFTRIVPVAIERSTYVLASSLALFFLFWQWRPLGGVIWDVQNSLGRAALYSGYGLGWVVVLYATFLINHFDLFGLRQVWLNLKGQPQTQIHFKMPVLYRIVRHPLYVGWFLTFWCTPTMTVTHLFFAFATSAYILIAVQLEERDLMKLHPEYAEYREQVPMFVPKLRRREAPVPATELTRG